MMSALLPQAEEFPVGTEISGIVVKGATWAEKNLMLIIFFSPVGSGVQSFAVNDEVCGMFLES